MDLFLVLVHASQCFSCLCGEVIGTSMEGDLFVPSQKDTAGVRAGVKVFGMGEWSLERGQSA